MENNMENITAETDEVLNEAETKKFNWKKEIREWITAILIAVVAAFFIRGYIFTLVQVQGPSMENTLHTGDRLIVTKLGYKPKQGDIVVFRPDQHKSEPYIKRVIAVEGQTVDIDFAAGKIYIDGKIYKEDYIKNPTTRQNDVDFPITVPDGCVFVLGDNRLESHDGRSLDVSSIKTKNVTENDYLHTYIDEESGELNTEALYYGCVDNDDLMGKAQFRLWPFDKFGSLY
ncbi:MAG: signal peptidase I [Clostridia bacterium]|nr:signal peptidase I [Clostridia bacterium]